MEKLHIDEEEDGERGRDGVVEGGQEEWGGRQGEGEAERQEKEIPHLLLLGVAVAVAAQRARASLTGSEGQRERRQ